MKYNCLKSIIFGFALLLMGANSYASVECSVTVIRYFVGDDGSLWVNWNQGGSGIISQSDPDFKPTLTTVIVGLLSNRTLTVRYADGTNCGAVPAPIIGLWIQ